ncbi:hypothetical protein TruAng_003290 [Truncatella angustata]|nr:hypothetical protein TruAng_003290 [Truncatella angustata]
MPKCRGKDITEATIEQLQKWLTDGAFSARDLTSCYLSRIEKLNKRLCAVIEVNPDALTIAEERDRERANGQYQGILHGIPFLVKDNIATKDKMQTTAGSSMLIGTKVILPADRCGVVGIKPTPGLTSCEGVIPESHNLDTVGTFGRTVADAAIALDGIYQGSKSFALHLADIEALKGARFGTPWLRIWKKAASDETSRIQYDALQGLLQRVKDAGAEIHPVNLPSIKEVVPQNAVRDYPSSRGHPERSEFTVVKVDFYNDLKKYLSNLITNPNNIRGLEDVIAYNINHTEREGGVAGTHPAWPTGQDSFDKSFRSAGIEDNIYHSALEYIRRKTREEGFDKALFVNGKELDGLLVPVQADGGVALQLAAQAGYPVITIPVGVDENGVPFGLAIMHKASREDQLIRFSSAIEHLVNKRPSPTFLNPDADGYLYIGAGPKEDTL